MQDLMVMNIVIQDKGDQPPYKMGTFRLSNGYQVIAVLGSHKATINPDEWYLSVLVAREVKSG